MISPVPVGVNPNTHRCGCGGMLRMPWVHHLKDHVLVCAVDPDHDTYQKKYTGTRMLFDGKTGQLKEYDVMSQRPTTELAPITDHNTALLAVERASDLGLFPGTQTPQQTALLAQVALAYGLDPLMGEIMPYQGRPYITIAGRRRLDAAVGHRPSVSFRILNADEMAYYKSVDALAEKDVAVFCVLRREGETVEGFGRILASERTGDKHLPTVARTIEMAQKRAERRAREIMFGPVAKPDSLRNIEVLEEGDEANVVEGSARVIEDDPGDGPPDLGNCPAHDVPWKVEEFHGLIRGSHFVEGEPWCQLNKLYGDRFQAAYFERFGETNAAVVNTWLKKTFNGRTWSKMDAPQHVEAVQMLAMGAPESAVQPPEGAEPSDRPDADNGAEETAEDARNAEMDMEIEREQTAAEH